MSQTDKSAFSKKGKSFKCCKSGPGESNSKVKASQAQEVFLLAYKKGAYFWRLTATAVSESPLGALHPYFRSLLQSKETQCCDTVSRVSSPESCRCQYSHWKTFFLTLNLASKDVRTLPALRKYSLEITILKCY